MNKNDDAFCLRLAKKIMSINGLGGKCELCNNNDIFTLEFHHQSELKSYSLSRMKDMRFSEIVKETEKCIVICGNCHMKLHYDMNRFDSRRNKLKLAMIEYKNRFFCEKCGYKDESGTSLLFHHCNGQKINDISVLSWEYKKGKISKNDIVGKLADELDKCIVICRNCHLKEHSNIDKFNLLQKEIEEKMKNYKEKRSSCVENVKKMYSMGISQIEISKAIGCAKSTVCEIIKRYGLKQCVAQPGSAAQSE